METSHDNSGDNFTQSCNRNENEMKLGKQSKKKIKEIFPK